MKSLSFERRLRLPVDPPRVIPRCSGLLLLFAFSQLAAGGEPQPGSKGAMPDRAAFLSREQSQRIIGFLTGDRLLRQGDGTFQTSAGKTPLSYASQNLAYWAESVCGAGDCRVRDVVRDPPFSLLGEDLQAFSTKMQIERVMMLQGTNIYDAAVWQIALALGAREGLLGRQEAGELIQGQLDRLRKVASRAEPQFTYGHDEARIKNAQYAYGLRFLAPAFMLPDPFRDTPYAGWIDTPPSFQDRFDKHISWMDWKPITGENAWANLLGPLQATFLLHGADVHQIPEDDPALQHALESLWPLQRMQSALGAFYYACNGALGNQGEEIEKNTVIVENNVSLLAALQVLEGTLQGVLESGQRLEPVERAKLTTGVNVIRIMLYGGGTPQGPTDGLLRFLRDHGYDRARETFAWGGVVDGRVFKSYQLDPATQHFALDGNTWGVLALGVSTVDAWFGEGAAYRIWRRARSISGYLDEQGRLWGMGYSENQVARVISPEWTFGALFLLEALLGHYQEHPSPGVDLAGLRADLSGMEQTLGDLQSDRYASQWSRFEDGLPPRFQSQLPADELAFLYASKRTFIPFGWYANPIPSLASTAWALMWSLRYNPLQLGASPRLDPESPPPYDPTDARLAYDPDAVSILNLFSDAEVIVSYRTAGGDSLPLIDAGDPLPIGGYRRVKLPAAAVELAAAFHNPWSTAPGWYGACRLALSPAVRDKLQGVPTQTAIRVLWSADGQAPCELISASP